MELKIVIDKNQKERILIYAHSHTPLLGEIEALVKSTAVDLTGYNDDGAVKLNVNDIVCFFTEDNKVFALTQDEKFRLKVRLYQLEDLLNDNFIKINQSCIANIKKISRFKATIGGALNVIFVNGHCDYVSRRNLKSVKERLEL